MKTRLRDLLKNNKLLNIVSNRYNLDKEDRKTLNEMISNQGGGTDDGMEYYLALDVNTNINIGCVINDRFSRSEGQEVASSGIEDLGEGDIKLHARGASINNFTIAFATSSRYCYDTRDRTTQKQTLEYICNELGTSLSDTSKFKRITAKEYYSLLDQN